jgi:hypothetical protein
MGKGLDNKSDRLGVRPPGRNLVEGVLAVRREAPLEKFEALVLGQAEGGQRDVGRGKGLDEDPVAAD